MLGRYIMFVFIIVCFTSCGTALKSDNHPLIQMLNKGDLNIDYRFVLFIPQNGCPSCIKKSYRFILDHSENNNVSYVFTDYSTKKAIKIYLNSMEVIDQDNFYFLEKSLGDMFDLSMMYPTLLETDSSGKVKTVLMNSDDYSDWQLLEKSL